MYAVIRTGGKQYKVAENDVIAVERLAGEAGAEVTFSEVLALHDGTALTVGAPAVDGALVIADVLEQGKADKVLVFKKKRRKNYRRMRGHRQAETVLRITAILADGTRRPAARKAETAAEAVAAESAAAAPKAAAPAKKAPAKKAPARKAPAKKAPARKAPAKKAPARKPAAKKAPARKSAARKE
jgi:large subunit ribosomal protein L21